MTLGGGDESARCRYKFKLFELCYLMDNSIAGNIVLRVYSPHHDVFTTS